jgi:N-acetyl-D-muramate 6-phosphate phosphatase
MRPNRPPSDGGFKAVFFDLDGTLVDTAPDMVAILTGMQDARRQQRLPYEVARNSVSNGALGLLRLGFPNAGDDELQVLLDEYLANYGNAICVKSEVFPPLRELLKHLTANERVWGVVTNKPQRMTDPLLASLDLARDAACAVSGDTLAERKPHPAPLLHAAQLAGVEPENAIYVGDAARDVEAGRAAGMATVAVGYGYISSDDNPNDWGADEVAADTMALVTLLLRAVDLETE